MDVLHVAHQFAPETRGGVESYVQDLVAEQRRRGLDARVLTGSMKPWTTVGVEPPDPAAEIPVYRLHRNDFFFDHHAVAWNAEVGEVLRTAVLRALHPRLLHVHQWIRLSSDLVDVAHQEGIPAVVTLHDFYTSCPRAFRVRPGDAACRRPVGPQSCWDCVPKYGHESRAELEEGVMLFAASYRSELALARKVLVAVAATADLLSETTGVPRSRYEVLPFGYRRRFAGEIQVPEPAAGEPFRFAFWGGVGRHKGVAVLIDAFRRLRAGGGAGELHVLGGFETPQFESELREAAKGLPVIFHGPFTPEQLRAVAPHAGVFPSTCLETWGIVLDECFELGVPCIVSDHGALPERAGGAGLKVAPGDAAALAAAMGRLESDRALWRDLRRGIPKLPPEMGAHCDALAAIYGQVGAAAPMRFAGPLPVEERRAFQRRQQESALGRIMPPDGPR